MNKKSESFMLNKIEMVPRNTKKSESNRQIEYEYKHSCDEM